MQIHTDNRTFRRRMRAMQRGQTIVVALLVLLLMAFVGGLFVSIVTHTLNTAARSNRVTTAGAYAQSGIRFANDQLTQSLDGADWRPPLQYAVASGNEPQDALGKARYNAYVTNNNLTTAPAQDPDKAYLDQGFARYTIGSGRFLLRLTYDPVGLNNTNGTPGSPYTDPQGRYIKIEAVGREGVVDAQDPTTYQNQPPTRLAATLVEYKAIGITDYARFETNPDKRSDIMALGVASREYTETGGNDGIVTPGVYDFLGNTGTVGLNPIVTTYGAPDAYLPSGGQLIPNPNAGATSPAAGAVAGGGSIHANGSVRFYGENHLYLNQPVSPASVAFNETAEIAGDLLLDSYNPETGISPYDLSKRQNAALILNPPATTPIPSSDYVDPTNTSAPNGFDTHSGAVRDAGNATDVSGYARNISRLEPPSLDTVNPVTNLTRYHALTQNAPPRLIDPIGGTPIPSYAAGSGAYGYGQAIYVNNSTDTQAESSKVVGGYTLVDEWLHRASAGAANHWLASFYRPPGVDIVLGRQQISTPAATGGGNTFSSFYGVRLTRSDTDAAGQPVTWATTLPNNTSIAGTNPSATTGTTLYASYKSLYASNDLAKDPATMTAAELASYQANPNNDVVIYAEGNVRVRGVVSADPSDNGTTTTYAGSSAGTPTDDDHLPRHVTIVTNGTAYIEGNLLRGNPNSSITVLAHDYVCVNTTQFLAGALLDENPVGTQTPGAFTGDPNLSALDFSGNDEVLLQEFQFGLPGSTPGNTYKDASNNALPLALYVSAGPSAPGGTSADFDILDPRTGTSINGGGLSAPFAAPLLLTSAFASTGAGASALLRTTFDLSALTTTPTLTALTQSQALQLAVRRTPVPNDPTATQDLLLERAAILPMDIRIEAVLFAQTRSFFVIPGDWFNTSPDDNLQNYVGSGARPGVDVTNTQQARYPFFGQPIDMKITVSGSVSEARPAEITAQSAWMQKWGWIPRFHGSLVTTPSTETNGHAPAMTPSVGLSLIYNPLAAYPYSTNYLRSDLAGRPLPYAPKLPVCAGLLYAGQNNDQPVLP